MLNNVKVEDSFRKIGYSNWKNTRSVDKEFQKHESSKFHQAAIQRLAEILKTTQDVFTTLKTTRDVSTMLKNNLTEMQCENRASLLKCLSCLCYLAGQELPFRAHGDDKKSNFKKLSKAIKKLSKIQAVTVQW